MHAILEYLAIGILIILFLTVSFAIISEVMGRLETVKEEQLYNVAERVMDKILLTPGDPPDWGTNFSNQLTDFGLALNGTRTPYVIDPDKVMRLANLTTLPNPLLVNSSEIADLLGIKNEYGFRLEIVPLLYVNVTPLEFYPVSGPATHVPSKIRVKVHNWYNFGVPGANVTAMLVLAKVTSLPGGSEKISYTVLVKSNITGALGTCMFDFNREINSTLSSGSTGLLYHFYILHVDWNGFVAIKGYSTPPQEGAPLTGYIIGDYVILNRSVITGNLSGAIITRDEVVEALPEYRSLLTVTNITWYPGAPPFNFTSSFSWTDYRVGKIHYVERLSSHVFVLGEWNGSLVVVVISRIPNIDISYGKKGATPPNSVTLTRIAQIYNYPYLVRLTLWRKVEG